jgi:hypothetical protein
VVGVLLLEHAAIALASRDLDASTFGVKTEVIRIVHTLGKQLGGDRSLYQTPPSEAVWGGR